MGFKDYYEGKEEIKEELGKLNLRDIKIMQQQLDGVDDDLLDVQKVLGRISIQLMDANAKNDPELKKVYDTTQKAFDDLGRMRIDMAKGINVLYKRGR